MTYKGKFKPRNPKKYKGNPTNIVYRSLWERQTFRWLDENPDVVRWSSEEIVIPYICATDRKKHRYFPDVYMKLRDGQEYLIEIKPKKETIPPKVRSRKTKKYIMEVLTWTKNESKWKYAESYCKDRGWIFDIWHEDKLKGLGIKLLTG